MKKLLVIMLSFSLIVPVLYCEEHNCFDLCHLEEKPNQDGNSGKK